MFIEIFGQKVNWVSQIFGLICGIFLFYAYIQKKKVNYLKYVAIAYVFCCIEAILLIVGGENAWSGVFSTSISIIRNLIMIYFLVKKEKDAPWWIGIIACLVLIGASIPFMGDWYTYLPSILVSALTISLLFKKYLVTQITNIFFEIGFVIYNFMIKSYAGVIRDGILSIVAIVALIVHFVKLKQLENVGKIEETINKDNLMNNDLKEVINEVKKEDQTSIYDDKIGLQ